jgi:hypothetical protein
MWYILPDSNKHYPLNIETVKKIKALNEKGIKPEELETAEVGSSSKTKEIEPQFVDVVGQISLKSLERNAQKKKQKDAQSGKGRMEQKNRGPEQQRERRNDGPKKNISISNPSSNKSQTPRQPIRPIKDNKNPNA